MIANDNKQHVPSPIDWDRHKGETEAEWQARVGKAAGLVELETAVEWPGGPAEVPRAFGIRIRDIPFPFRMRTALDSVGIHYVGDLVQYSATDLLTARGIHYTALDILRATVAVLGLHLAMDAPKGWQEIRDQLAERARARAEKADKKRAQQREKRQRRNAPQIKQTMPESEDGRLRAVYEKIVRDLPQAEGWGKIHPDARELLWRFYAVGHNTARDECEKALTDMAAHPEAPRIVRDTARAIIEDRSPVPVWSLAGNDAIPLRARLNDIIESPAAPQIVRDTARAVLAGTDPAPIWQAWAEREQAEWTALREQVRNQTITEEKQKWADAALEMADKANGNPVERALKTLTDAGLRITIEQRGGQ